MIRADRAGLALPVCARIAARLNTGLLNQGPPISKTEVFIAATGLRHKCTVVTNNPKDFRRIDSLALEDWRTPWHAGHFRATSIASETTSLFRIRFSKKWLRKVEEILARFGTKPGDAIQPEIRS